MYKAHLLIILCNACFAKDVERDHDLAFSYQYSPIYHWYGLDTPIRTIMPTESSLFYICERKVRISDSSSTRQLSVCARMDLHALRYGTLQTVVGPYLNLKHFSNQQWR